jgi:hypothetical protein
MSRTCWPSCAGRRTPRPHRRLPRHAAARRHRPENRRPRAGQRRTARQRMRCCSPSSRCPKRRDPPGSSLPRWSTPVARTPGQPPSTPAAGTRRKSSACMKTPPSRQADIEQLARIAAPIQTPNASSPNSPSTRPMPPATAGSPLLDEDYLILSTIHSAKGQEWTAVAVLNAVDGCIPSDLAIGSAIEIEEERRLLYVAMTRARNHLELMHSATLLRLASAGIRRPPCLCQPHALHPECAAAAFRAGFLASAAGIASRQSARETTGARPRGQDAGDVEMRCRARRHRPSLLSRCAVRAYRRRNDRRR